MENLYEKLKKEKENGAKLNFDEITYNELRDLFEFATDGMIAELYNVSKYQVTKKRNDFGIKLINIVFDHTIEDMKRRGLI